MSLPDPPDALHQTASQTVIEVVHASDNLPEFLTSDPALWFVQLEATFDLRATDVSKKRKCVSKLPQTVLPQVSDLLTNDTPYSLLKSHLLTLYDKDRDTKITTLLNGVRMGDEKPSMLLRRMKYIAGEANSDLFLKNLWLRALPSQFRTQLALCDSQDLSALAKEADKIAAAASINSPHDNTTEKIAALTESVSNLMSITSQLTAAAISKNERTSARSPDRFYARRERSRSPAQFDNKRQYERPQMSNQFDTRQKSTNRTKYSRSYDNNNDSAQQSVKVCKFHLRFKARARNCIPPCHFHSPTPKNE